MRSIVLLFCCVLSTFSMAQDNLPKYPSYEQVVDAYLKEFSPQAMADGETFRLNFEKTPDGWYFTTSRLEDGEPKVKERALFWSPEKKEFLASEHQPLKGISEEDLRRQLMAVDVNGYAIHHYYGYEYWYKDVISNTSGVSEHISERALYSLARAYSAQATAEIGFHSVDAAGSDLNFTDLHKNGYTYNKEQAVLHFKLLKQTNPDFQTLIGNAHTKYSAEQVISWVHSKAIGWDDNKEKFLEDDLFNDALISMARNQLIACEKDAIYFTSGDLVTLPLIYVQDHLGFRKDVLVINKDLLNLPAYATFIHKELEERGAKFLLDPETLLDPKTRYALFEDDPEMTAPSISTRELITIVNEYVKSKKNDPPYIRVPKRLITIGESPSNSGSTLNTFVSKSITLKFKMALLYRSDLVALDIISANFKSRSLAFSQNLAAQNYLRLGNWLRYDGAVLQMQGVAKQQNTRDKPMHVEAVEDNLLKHYTYKGLSEKPISCTGTVRMAQQYRTLFSQLANHYRSQKDFEKAKMVLDKALKVISVEAVPYGYGAIAIARVYNELDQKEKAQDLCEQIMLSLEERINSDKTDNNIRKNLVRDYRFLAQSNFLTPVQQERTKAFLTSLDGE